MVSLLEKKAPTYVFDKMIFYTRISNLNEIAIVHGRNSVNYDILH